MQIQGSAMIGEGSERLESLHACSPVVAIRMNTFGTFESRASENAELSVICSV